MVGHFAVVHETAGGPYLSFLEARFYFLHQVTGVFVVDVEVTVSGQFNGVSVLDIIPWE